VQLTTHTRDSQGARLLKIQGTLDSTTTDRLAESLETALKDKCRWLIVELDDIDYVSSAGWGAFVAFSKDFGAAGAGLVLTGIPPHLRLAWKALGLEKLIPTFNTVDDAFNHVRAAGKAD